MPSTSKDDKKKKKSTNKKKRGSDKKSKKKSKNKTSFSNKQLETLARAKEDAKIEFEKTRDQILNAVPDEYKNMFGQIGFVKWGSYKQRLPVLILSPYDVPPGSVRQKWMDMFEKMQTRGALHTLSLLVYWYGQPNIDSCYSFVAQKSFVSYDKESAKGVAKGSVHKLPAKIQAKLDSGNKKLTTSEQDTVNAYQELEEDLLKEPKDRKRGILNFPEGWEMLSEKDLSGVHFEKEEEEDLTMGDDDSDDDAEEQHYSDEMSSTQDNGDEEEEEDDLDTTSKNKKRGGSKAGKKAKRSKKRKAGFEEDDEEGNKPPAKKKRKKVGRPKKNKTEDEDEGDAAPDSTTSKRKKAGRPKKAKSKEVDLEVDDGKARKKPGRPKKAGKPKDVVDDAEIGDAEMDESEEKEDAGSKNKKARKSKEVVDAEIGDAEIDSSEEKEDLDEKPKSKKKNKVPSKEEIEEDRLEEEYALKDDIPSEDEADDEYDGDGDVSNKPASRRVAQSKKDKTIIMPSKKVRGAKKSQKPKHKTQTEKQMRERETKAFRKCEKDFADLFQRWETVVASGNVEELQKLLAGEVMQHVDDFCATYMAVYVHQTLKNSKKALKNAQADLTIYNKLREKMKELHEKKSQYVPQGFTLQKANPSSATTVTAVTVKTEKKESSDEKGLDGSSDRPIPRANTKNAMGDGSERSTERIAGAPKSPPSTCTAAARSLVDQKVSAAATHPNKPERKKFSLGDLMRPAKAPPPHQQASEQVAGDVSEPKQQARPIPQWIAGPAKLEAPTEDPRALAMEFLLQMARRLPGSRVDVDSVARSLEAAIWKWARQEGGRDGASSDDYNWVPKYWEKVHALVSAFCGQRETGTLARLIARFDSPDKVVALPEDKILASFQGHPVDI